MRYLQFRTSGEHYLPTAPQQISCIMLFPNDEKRQGELFDNFRMHAFQLDLMRNLDGAPIPRSIALQMADFGNIGAIGRRIHRAISSGRSGGEFAGKVLLDALCVREVGRRPSLSTLLAKIDCDLTREERVKAFDAYKDVAHFWAARVLLLCSANEDGLNVVKGDERFPCDDGMLPYFLGISSEIFAHAIDYRTKDDISLLDVSTAWGENAPVKDLTSIDVSIESFSESAQRIISDRRGSPQFYDWHSFHGRLRELFLEKGIPQRDGKPGWRFDMDAVRLMDKWCRDNGWHMKNLDSQLRAEVKKGRERFTAIKIAEK